MSYESEEAGKPDEVQRVTLVPGGPRLEQQEQIDAIATHDLTARDLASSRGDDSAMTWRATAVGLGIGLAICLSNTWFGLQSGFIAIMSLPAAVLGYAFFKLSLGNSLLLPHSSRFTPSEHATLIVIASSMGVMPFTIGAVGVVPAMEFLTNAHESGPFPFTWPQLLVWSLGVSIFGVLVALPLRKQFLVREPLAFPFGTATASLIALLHKDESIAFRIKKVQQQTPNDDKTPAANNGATDDQNDAQLEWSRYNRWILAAFSLAATYSIASYFVPQIRRVPIAPAWLFALSTSPGYTSLGLIIPPITTMYIVTGCIIGWAILSPLAKFQGWAPGPVGDWDMGSRGWILWIAVALILGDAIVTISSLVWRTVTVYAKTVLRQSWWPFRQRRRSRSQDESTSLLARSTESSATQEEAISFQEDGISSPLLWCGILLSGALCFSSMRILFGNAVSLWALVLAVLLIVPLSLVGIRCYGETGSGGTESISKIPLFLFTVLIPQSNPNAILVCLSVAGVVEAGVWQSAEMLDEFQLGHLVDAQPRSLFLAQLVGSSFGAITSALVYRLYTSSFQSPADKFAMPSAHIWIATARLVYGTGMPPGLLPFVIVSASLAAAIKAVKTIKSTSSWVSWLPSCVALATGMYVIPEIILAQGVGGCIQFFTVRYFGLKKTGLLCVATGLILGEGVFSLANLVMDSFGVPHL